MIRKENEKHEIDKTGENIMEYWDIYDAEKRLTGRTMKRNDWCLKDGEYHLTVLGRKIWSAMRWPIFSV